MLRSFFLLPILVLCCLLTPRIESPVTLSQVPLPPDTGAVVAATTSPTDVAPAQSVVAAIKNIKPRIKADTNEPTDDEVQIADPISLSIPSINLSSRVVSVGLTSTGEMDVPSGSSSNVGWYKGGTVPGNLGSAVFDAHVFAAFSKLRNLSVGSSVYVETSTHQKLHFKVVEMQTYKLGELPPDLLFNRSDAKRLNLITCAGKLTADHSTYDHRLVIFAELVE